MHIGMRLSAFLLGCLLIGACSGEAGVAQNEAELVAQLNADAQGAVRVDFVAEKEAHFVLTDGHVDYVRRSCFPADPMQLDASSAEQCDKGDKDFSWQTERVRLPLGSIEPASFKTQSAGGPLAKGLVLSFSSTCVGGSDCSNEMGLLCRDAEACQRMARTLLKLDGLVAQAANTAGTRAQPLPGPGADNPLIPAAPTIGALLVRVNDDIGEGVWIDGNVVIYAHHLAETGDGRLLMQAKFCRADTKPDMGFVRRCLTGKTAETSATVSVDAAAIDLSATRTRPAWKVGMPGGISQEADASAIVYGCAGGASCVVRSADSSAFSQWVLYCDTRAGCARLVTDVGALITTLKPVQPALLAPAPRVMGPADALARVQSAIDRGVSTEGQTVTWTTIDIEQAGRFVIGENPCDVNGSLDAAAIASCRSARPSSLRSRRHFDAVAVDPASIRVENGSRLSFACRQGFICGIEDMPADATGSGDMASHGTLICNDHAACAQLVADFGAFIAALSRGDPFLARAPAQKEQLLALVRKISDRIRAATVTTPGTVLWQPGFGLAGGQDLAFVRAVCEADDMDLGAPSQDDLAGRCRRSAGDMALEHKYGVATEYYPMRVHIPALDGAAISIAAADVAKHAQGMALEFVCRSSSGCVTNDLDGQSADAFRLNCQDQASCADLYHDIKALFGLLSPSGAMPSTPSGAAPAAPALRSLRALDSTLSRVNADIDRSVWLEGSGMLVTTAVSREGSGGLRITGHRCPLTRRSSQQQIDACRAEAPVGADTSVIFAAADIDGATIRLDSSNAGSRVTFYCKAKSACVMRPDRSRYFPGAYLACQDATACNRLVGDFASLVDLAAQQH